MTHAEEYENFVGSDEPDPSELCRHCHDYPCSCSLEDIILHADWDAEIEAHSTDSPVSEHTEIRSENQ